MKLCSKCLHKTGILVEYPQLLKVYVGCDGCKSLDRKAFSVEAVVLQNMEK